MVSTIFLFFLHKLDYSVFDFIGTEWINYRLYIGQVSVKSRSILDISVDTSVDTRLISFNYLLYIDRLSVLDISRSILDISVDTRPMY